MRSVDDRFGRGKWGFWLFVSVLLGLTLVPSAVLLRAARTYYRFLTGAAPDTVRPVRMTGVDAGRSAKPLPDKDLRLAEFRLKAPKASDVEIIGDFSDWKAEGLRLARGSDGAWEIMLPLSPGRYRYQFLVDGQSRLDPQAPAEKDDAGRKASVRRIR